MLGSGCGCWGFGFRIPYDGSCGRKSAHAFGVQAVAFVF